MMSKLRTRNPRSPSISMMRSSPDRKFGGDGYSGDTDRDWKGNQGRSGGGGKNKTWHGYHIRFVLTGNGEDMFDTGSEDGDGDGDGDGGGDGGEHTLYPN